MSYLILAILENILGCSTYNKGIDDYTKEKFLNMQLENLVPMINIEKNDKQTDDKYQKKLMMTNNLMKEIR